MHKTAGKLKPKDRFLMAGGHYIVVDVYETKDEDMIKVVFNQVNAVRNMRYTLILERSLLFTTT